MFITVTRAKFLPREDSILISEKYIVVIEPESIKINTSLKIVSLIDGFTDESNGGKRFR